MAIIIRDVTDADLVRACEIEGAAYADSPLSPVLFPGPFPPEAKHQRVPLLIEMRNNDATAQYLQAYDEETGQLIAFAKWHVYDSPEAAATAFQPSRIFGPGANKEACEEFFTGLTSKKNELIGDRAHLYLHMLHTDPAFQGRGAGGLLVEWGAKKADALGLPAYLAATAKGRRIYLRYGFEDAMSFDFDAGKYGGTGVSSHPLMKREPSQSV